MDGPVTSEDYVVSEDTKYVFQEKIGLSLSSDSGRVYDESGEEEVFKIKGKRITIHDSVWLQTADDDENDIIGMRKALVSLHDTVSPRVMCACTTHLAAGSGKPIRRFVCPRAPEAPRRRR